MLFIACAGRQEGDEIHSDVPKVAIWYRQWLKQFLLSFAIGFVSTTGMAGLQVSGDGCSHILPIIMDTEPCVSDIAFDVTFLQRFMDMSNDIDL